MTVLLGSLTRESGYIFSCQYHVYKNKGMLQKKYYSLFNGGKWVSLHFPSQNQVCSWILKAYFPCQLNKQASSWSVRSCAILSQTQWWGRRLPEKGRLNTQDTSSIKECMASILHREKNHASAVDLSQQPNKQLAFIAHQEMTLTTLGDYLDYFQGTFNNLTYHQAHTMVHLKEELYKI